jgi:hypothetical protein
MADDKVLLTLAKSVAVMASVIAASAGRRMALAVAGYACVAGLFAISLCFLTLSGYRAMARALDDVYAALIVGCIYLVVALAALVIVQSRRR